MNVETPSMARPCVMVIFGATGDLTKRKLIPALINLAQENVLSKRFAIIGVASNDYTTETFRRTLGEEVPQIAPEPIDLKLWEWLSERIYYVKGDFADSETYKRIKDQIDEADRLHSTQGNKFFYLAVAPRFFATSVQPLGAVGLSKE